MKTVTTISVEFCLSTLLFNFKRHCTIKFLEEGMSPLCFQVKQERMREKFGKNSLALWPVLTDPQTFFVPCVCESSQYCWKMVTVYCETCHGHTCNKIGKLKLLPGCGFSCSFLHWATSWACESNWGCISRMRTLKSSGCGECMDPWTLSSPHSQCLVSHLHGTETPT